MDGTTGLIPVSAGAFGTRRAGAHFPCCAGGLKRVLLNLIGNSLKVSIVLFFFERDAALTWTSLQFTEDGFVKLSIRQGKSARHSTVVIDVEDTGKGMDKEFVRTKLFTPFVQGDPFSGGAGLGCSITAQIVKRMKGSIDVTR